MIIRTLLTLIRRIFHPATLPEVVFPGRDTTEWETEPLPGLPPEEEQTQILAELIQLYRFQPEEVPIPSWLEERNIDALVKQAEKIPQLYLVQIGPEGETAYLGTDPQIHLFDEFTHYRDSLR